MTILEWTDKFSTDEKCRDYLFQQRWPDGFLCPKRQGQKCCPNGPLPSMNAPNVIIKLGGG